MSKVHLNHSIVGYFITLAPGANVQEFEQMLAAKTPEHGGEVTYMLSKTVGAERSYLWTAQIAQAGGVDRGGRPLVLRDVLGVISEVHQSFPVDIKQAFWTQAQTPAGIVEEFNQLPGMLLKFGATA